MENKKKHAKKMQVHQEETAMELTEDTTQYGEFIPSFHKWLTPEQQKETVEKLVNLKDHPVKKDLL